MNKSDPRKALGKGLHALLPNRTGASGGPAPAAPVSNEPKDGQVAMIQVGQVRGNPNQPRRDFDPVALAELSASIEQDGIIQPIIVRRAGPNQYEIIAGERRWRAAKAAGLPEIPAIIRSADDNKVLELAIVENVQREDLNPIELAAGFQRMAADLGLSHDEIGDKTGKDRATITNSIRLLQLPEDLQALVVQKKLSAGHARALLKIEEPELQREIAGRAVAEGWTVRQVEEYTRPEPRKKKPEQPTLPPFTDPNTKAAVSEMENALGTRVRLREKGVGGVIEIEYYSTDDLDRLYNHITRT